MTKQKPNPKTPPMTVSTMGELAAFCGVSVTTIKNWKSSRGFPIEDDGGYSPFKVGQWHAMRMVAPSDPEIPEGEEDLESANPSPALEKLRHEKWLIARMDRREREQGLVARDKIHNWVMRIAFSIRGWTDKLQRKFGPDAHQMAMDMLDDIETDTEREFGGDDWIDDSEEQEADAIST